MIKPDPIQIPLEGVLASLDKYQPAEHCCPCPPVTDQTEGAKAVYNSCLLMHSEWLMATNLILTE